MGRAHNLHGLCDGGLLDYEGLSWLPLLSRHAVLLDQRLLQAGIRLAGVLNQLFA